jgi:cyclase
VPGHGPLCGIKETRVLRDYFELVYEESKKFFDQGLWPLDAAKQMDLGSFMEWTEPQRLIYNVDRAYREFEGKPWDTPIDAMQMMAQGHELKLYWERKAL